MSLHESLEFRMLETEDMIERNNVITIAPEGLGYGTGTISVQDNLNNPEHPLSQAMLDTVGEMVHHQEAMQPVVRNDKDNCIDGRKALRVLEAGEVYEPQGILPKVAGGGITMGVAGLVGTGKVGNEPLTNVFQESQSLFQSKGRNYGAHSADKAAECDCGCGAIDKAPEIWKNSVTFREQITANILAVAGTTDDGSLADRIDSVYDNIEQFNSYQDDVAEDYKGKDVINTIADNGKIVVELGGKHNEVRIVVNVDIEDFSFDQNYIRNATDDNAQVFTFDVPRMRSIANMFEHNEDRTDALLSMMVYTFATAATLTKGDLPVDVVHREKAEIDFLQHEFQLTA